MKTKQDYYNYGRALQQARTPLPFITAMSWQQRAMQNGFNQAAQQEEAVDLGLSKTLPVASFPAATAAHVESLRRMAQEPSCTVARRNRLYRKVEALHQRYATRTA